MVSRYVVASGGNDIAAPSDDEREAQVVVLDWASHWRNSVSDVSELTACARFRLPSSLQDLLDIATAVYLADIATPRGSHEEWVRHIRLDIPVRDVRLWDHASPTLTQLIYTLTRDSVQLSFRPMEADEAGRPEAVENPAEVDCVCLLSGGLDSLAGATMLLRAGRRPLLLSHRSGNPAVEATQRQVVAVLGKHWPGQFEWVGVRIAATGGSSESREFPAPGERENSRRARSLLFMALGATAACATGVNEVYFCENGILTAALPMTPARSGSLSTRSTHPHAIRLFSDLLPRLDAPCTIENPFLYQTKGEAIRTFLKPVLSPTEIESTTSCWAAGRHPRQCGGCVPCLLRRVSMLSAGLPDEACQLDVLGAPEQHRGTEAYGNLIDLLTQAATFLGKTEFDLLIEYPQLLDLNEAGVHIGDMIRTLKRHAAEVYAVLDEHFPASAKLMQDAPV